MTRRSHGHSSPTSRSVRSLSQRLWSPWVLVLSVVAGACPGQGSAANTVGGEGSDGTVDTLSQLKFGYPTMVALENGEILCSFWCFEDDVYCIRYLRLAVN